jgi:hypothetical protein
MSNSRTALLAQRREQAAMSRLGTGMADDAMVQQRRVHAMQRLPPPCR